MIVRMIVNWRGKNQIVFDREIIYKGYDFFSIFFYISDYSF